MFESACNQYNQPAYIKVDISVRPCQRSQMAIEGQSTPEAYRIAIDLEHQQNLQQRDGRAEETDRDFDPG